MPKFALKRCPFCNHHDLTLDQIGTVFSIRCYECGAMGPHSMSINRAITLWNGEASLNSGANHSALVYDRKSNRDDKKEVEL